MSTILLGVLYMVIQRYTWTRTKPDNFPTVNSYPNDLLKQKAKAAFMSDARGLVREGVEKVNYHPTIANSTNRS